MESPHRELCLNCRRPASVCWCASLKPMHSHTRVVFVQHPRESRVPISTCRMAHLSLPNSEMHVGLGLARAPQGAAVLFPSDDAVDVATLDTPPSCLVVVDGTWSTARKVVQRDPVLRALPRLRVNPDRPGNYRIRKEPKAHCLSTIEAVALVLGHLEGEPLRFQPILSAFDRMVETQLGHIGSGPSRHKRLRDRNGRRADLTAPLREAWPQLVLAYAEANGWPAQAGVPGAAELIQLVALKPASGERFEALIAPRRPLAPRVSCWLGASVEELRESVGEALARWRAFAGEGAVATWGPYTLDLLAAEGAVPARPINLKHVTSQLLFRSAGGIERFAEEASGERLPESHGRAARRIAALSKIAGWLNAHSGAQDHSGAH